MAEQDDFLTTPPDNAITLTKAQSAFLVFCQKFGWGILEVQVRNGQPVVATITKQTVKFD